MVYGAVFVVRVVLVWCFLRSKNRDFVCVETNLESTVNAEFCDVNTIDPDHLVACVCSSAVQGTG